MIDFLMKEKSVFAKGRILFYEYTGPRIADGKQIWNQIHLAGILRAPRRMLYNLCK